MNRRGFFQSVLCVLGWLAAPKPMKALAPVEFTTTEWEWVPLQWNLPEKPCIDTFRFDSNFGGWIRIQVREKEETSYFNSSNRNELTFIPFDGNGAWQLETGYDPETGCYDN